MEEKNHRLGDKPNRSGYWEMVYVVKVDKGEWRSKTLSTQCKDLNAAKAALKAYLRDIKQRSDDARTEGLMDTLSVCWDYYRETMPAASVKAQTRSIRVAMDYWGDIDPREWDVGLYNRYLARRRAEGVKDGTIRRQWGAVKTVVRHYAMAQAGSLRIKDIEAFKSPKEGKPRVDYLDLDEEQEFWDLAIAYSTGKPLTPRTRFICLGLDAGARAEAICDLTWDRVGRGKGCRANVDMLEFQLPGAIETKKRRATVPISERLAPVLEQARAQAWDEALAQAGGSVAKAEKVLMGMKVVGISAASLCSSWRDWPPVMKPSRSGTGKGKALRRSRTGKFAHITPHILRHTFGTLRAQAGFSVFKLAALMGDTVATIEKNYLKHAPHLYADAVNLPARVIKAKVEEADA